MLIDFSRSLNASERETLEKRLERMRLLREPVGRASEAFQRAADGPAERHELAIRNGFAYRSNPAPGDGSDRRVPERKLRPPATRIASSRGAALRLELIALALAQAQSRRRR